MGRSVLAFSLAVLIAGSGCGFVFARGPSGPIAPGSPPPDCTTTKAPAYVDGLLTGAMMGTALFLLLAAAGDEDKRSDYATASLFTFLGSIPVSISGIVGGHRVNKCRSAHQRWRQLQFSGPPSSVSRP